MTADPRSLIDGYLDDALNTDQQSELAAWIQSDAENARTFARSVLLHDRLRNILCAELGDAGERKPLDKLEKATQSLVPVGVWKVVGSLAALAAGLAIVWFSFGSSNASAAIRELDRIILKNLRSKDRTYEIVVEDVSPEGYRGNRPAKQESNRPPKPPLDGATLHVRSGNQFVLIRNTSERLPFVTGSNGNQSWAVNTRGPVKVSDDVHRFDHDLPGHETSVPLTNLHEGLEQLKKSYHLQFSMLGPEEYEPQDGEQIRSLVAVKKPKERGPQRVEITYASETGRILRMRFVQMPYGPDRLDLHLSLLNEDELPSNFFDSRSHHSPDRKIEIEN